MNPDVVVDLLTYSVCEIFSVYISFPVVQCSL